MKILKSPLGGTVAELLVVPGQTVSAEAVLLVVQSMKMFYEIRADKPARIVGIEAKTIRFYEKAGLFHPSRASGTRIFRFEDIAALRVIKMLRALGVNVKEIKRVMTCAHFESRAAQHSPCLVKLVEEQLMRQRKEVEILQHNLSVAESFVISTAA